MRQADAAMEIPGGTLLMNKRLLIAALFATALSGCATYDHVGYDGPGGYYHGRPTAGYYSPYDSPYGYGGVSVYGGYGYRDYYGYPYYGYYGSHYPYYRPHHPPPRPPRPGDDKPDPPTAGPSRRPPPWRDPTNGAYRESGQVMIPPRYQRPSTPAPTSPQVRRETPTRIAPRPQEARRDVERPRTIERAARPPAVRSAPRSTAPSRREQEP